MMYGHDDNERQSKMQSLMDLVKKMKELQAEDAKPKAAILEVHEEHAFPLAEVEESSEVPEGDQEDAMSDESPEHESSESIEQEAEEHGLEKPDIFEEEEEDESLKEPMSIPPALLKLLAERLHK